MDVLPVSVKNNVNNLCYRSESVIPAGGTNCLKRKHLNKNTVFFNNTA